jgi:hypothetical protein
VLAEMNIKSISLLIIGVIFFIAGWMSLLNGIEVKSCSSYLYVPKSFSGEIMLSYTEWLYWTNIPLNVSGFYIKGNATKNIEFAVNKSMGWINLVIIGEPIKQEYKGSIVISNASDPSQAIITMNISPMQSVGSKGMNISAMFLQTLSPGKYILSVTLDTDAYIHRIALSGPSSTELEKVAPKITLTPDTYDQIKIDYICGISFSSAFIATILVSISMATTIASALVAQISGRPLIKTDIKKLKKSRK